MTPAHAPQALGSLLSDAIAAEHKLQVARQLEAAKAENAARRERVLKHPDLAERLTRQPLNFRQPELWNGYIPPRRSQPNSCTECEYPPQRIGVGRRKVDKMPGCEHSDHVSPLNDSLRRRALAEIDDEALRRGQTD